MSETTRRLVLLRHATAEPAGPDGDEARHLSDGGVSEARAVGRWLKNEGLLGDVVVCSSALRTRETWAAIQDETGHGVIITMEPAVYEADTQALLAVVHELDATAPEATSAIVVGHAPGLPQLAHDLCAGEGADIDVVTRGFVPASAAVLETTGAWTSFLPGGASLTTARTGTAG